MSQGILRRLNKDSEGFTLVELMIVVAIIGILAAIAIPQFAAYRIRGFNSACLSDTKNLATNQAAMFADVQSFGQSAPNAAQAVATGIITYVGNNGANGGLLMTAPPTAGNVHTLAFIDAGATSRGVVVGLSNGVSVAAHTEGIAGAPVITAVSFAAVGKHLNGDTFYGVDGDTESVYQDKNEGTTGAGHAMVVADLPNSRVTLDEFRGVNGPSGVAWVAK